MNDAAWSSEVHDGIAVGASTLDDGESFGYDFEYEAMLGTPEEGWRITDGSGSGNGGASHLWDASGSGSYSTSFDDGAGTVNGTVSAAEHDGWDYAYHQDYLFANDEWATTESGSGSAEGSTTSEYSGSGSYSGTSTVSGVTTSASGSVDENGSDGTDYDATFSWTDADWTMTRNFGGGSFSHRREMDETATQTSTSSGSFAGGNGSYNDVVNSISHDLETQSESSMSGTDTETHQGNTVTWSQAGSGSASGFVQSTNGTGYSANWGIATNDGTTSRVETGYSSNANSEFDRVESESSWSHSAAQDGSTAETASSGGQHDWSDTSDMAWNIQWTETTTWGGGSGSGGGYSSGSGSGSGGGGGGSTTSGGNSGISHWTSGSSSSWTYSSSNSTPATPGSNVNTPPNFFGRSGASESGSEEDDDSENNDQGNGQNQQTNQGAGSEQFGNYSLLNDPWFQHIGQNGLAEGESLSARLAKRDQYRQDLLKIDFSGVTQGQLDELALRPKTEAESDARDELGSPTSTSEEQTWGEYTYDAAAGVFVGDVAGRPTNFFGFVGSVAFGLTGLDAYKDVADLGNSLYNFKPTWSHVRGIALNAVAIIPVIGVVKNLKKGVDLAQTTAKSADDAAAALKAAQVQDALKKIDAVPIPAGFKFGDHLRSLIGDPPAGMIDPHAHHILFKKGLGLAQQELVEEGQAILRKVGIDPIYGKENLVWAPWRVSEQHGIESLKKVVDKLKELEKAGGDYDDFADLLKRLGKDAADRT